MGELGLSIIYLLMATGFITLMLWFIDQMTAGGA